MDTIIDFLRHGEPVGSSTYRGNGVDDPLSEKGWSQMWNAVGNHPSWDAIFCSPLSRCRSFAEKLGKKYTIPIIVDDRLKEVGFGSWEGRQRAEIRQSNPDEYAAFYQDPVNCRPLGAEDLSDFSDRVLSAVERIREEYPEQHILVVTHAGVIRATIMHVTQQSVVDAYSAKVVNASFTRIRYTKNNEKLEFKNRTFL